MSAPVNLSVPPYSRCPPRTLTDNERRCLHRIADALIPPAPGRRTPSQLPGFDRWLDRALAARDDAFEKLLAAATRLAEVDDYDLLGALKRFDAADPEGFHLVSSVVAGAYLMIPEVRAAIGYPGQRRHHAKFDEAADQIMDGILDPVIERGSVYTPAPAPQS
jgi:hypothetical protein